MGALSSRKLASEDAVRRFIVEAIENGSAPAGARLPTERVLAKRFRVPRSVVRKALLPLEIEGKVTYVSSDGGAGVKFTFRDGGGSRRLRELIRRIRIA